MPKGSCEVFAMTMLVSAPSLFVTALNNKDAGAMLLGVVRSPALPLCARTAPVEFVNENPRAWGNEHAATTYPSKPGAKTDVGVL